MQLVMSVEENGTVSFRGIFLCVFYNKFNSRWGRDAGCVQTACSGRAHAFTQDGSACSIRSALYMYTYMHRVTTCTAARRTCINVSLTLKQPPDNYRRLARALTLIGRVIVTVSIATVGAIAAELYDRACDVDA